MKLSIKDVRHLLGDAIDQYELMYGSADVEIPYDYYWQVSGTDVFDFQRDPKEFQLEVGSFEDEIPQLLDTLNGDSVMNSNHIQFLAAILRYISDQQLGEDASVKPIIADGGK